MTMLGAYELNTVHCVDALTLLKGLPEGSVDIVVTSPPYNMEWHGLDAKDRMRTAKWRQDFYAEAMPEPEYQVWLYSVVAECIRVGKGLVWVNHKTRYRGGVGIHPLSFLTFPFWAEVIWNKGQSIQLNSRRFAPSHEFVYGFGKPHYWNDALNSRLSDWLIVPERKDDGHPCPFPEPLVERLIEASCPPDGVVLDPFMGSGTTAIVAQRMERQFIGCDISEKYVALANKRIAKPFTKSMFAEQLP